MVLDLAMWTPVLGFASFHSVSQEGGGPRFCFCFFLFHHNINATNRRENETTLGEDEKKNSDVAFEMLKGIKQPSSSARA